MDEAIVWNNFGRVNCLLHAKKSSYTAIQCVRSLSFSSAYFGLLAHFFPPFLVLKRHTFPYCFKVSFSPDIFGGSFNLFIVFHDVF